MWKDTEYFKNKGDLHRWAVFLLLQLGEHIQDTEMILVDRTLTDISFQNSVLFVLVITSWLTPRSPWQQCKMGSAHTTSPSPATKRTLPGCPFTVACVAAWWLSLSA